MSLKTKDLHIVFRHADRTIMDSSVFDPDDIDLYKLVDDLSIGPIWDLPAIDDGRFRKEWLEKTFGDLVFKDDILSAVDKDIALISTIVEMADKCKDIYIWTGRDASEVINTARVLSRLIKLDKRIYVLDFSDINVRNIDGIIVSPKSLLQTASFQIKDVANHFRQQTITDLQKWESMWSDIKSVRSHVRVLDKDGSICHVQDSFFDTSLLSYCKSEFQEAARVIGPTLADIDFAVSDSYLNWRLKELANNKKLQYRGCLIEIRDYEVRLYNGEN